MHKNMRHIIVSHVLQTHRYFKNKQWGGVDWSYFLSMSEWDTVRASTRIGVLRLALICNHLYAQMEEWYREMKELRTGWMDILAVAGFTNWSQRSTMVNMSVSMTESTMDTEQPIVRFLLLTPIVHDSGFVQSIQIDDMHE